MHYTGMGAVRVPADIVWNSNFVTASVIIGVSGAAINTTASSLSATSGTYAWKGIPFARAPVGDLRFAPPQPAQRWPAPRSRFIGTVGWWSTSGAATPTLPTPSRGAPTASSCPTR